MIRFGNRQVQVDWILLSHCQLVWMILVVQCAMILRCCLLQFYCFVCFGLLVRCYDVECCGDANYWLWIPLVRFGWSSGVLRRWYWRSSRVVLVCLWIVWILYNFHSTCDIFGLKLKLSQNSMPLENWGFRMGTVFQIVPNIYIEQWLVERLISAWWGNIDIVYEAKFGLTVFKVKWLILKI